MTFAALIRFTCPLLVTSLLLTGCSKDKTVAKAGRVAVNTEQLQDLYSTLPSREREELAQNPELLSQTTRLYVIHQLILKEAQSKKWEDKSEVKKQLTRLRDNAIVESYLQSVCTPGADFPAEPQIRAVYDQNKDNLKVGRSYRLAQIYIASQARDPRSTEAARAKILDIQKSLQQPNSNFSAQAMAWSEEGRTSKKGGELGWMSESRIQPEIRAAIQSLSKGGLSEPVLTADGWHLMKVLDVREAHAASFEEAKPAIVQKLRADKAQANRQEYLKKLLDQNPVNIDNAALSHILATAAAPSTP
jgi:parvulin-like peptidyl-prolyl isomerase